METIENEIAVYLEKEGVRNPVGPVFWIKGNKKGRKRNTVPPVGAQDKERGGERCSRLSV